MNKTADALVFVLSTDQKVVNFGKDIWRLIIQYAPHPNLPKVSETYNRIIELQNTEDKIWHNKQLFDSYTSCLKSLLNYCWLQHHINADKCPNRYSEKHHKYVLSVLKNSLMHSRLSTRLDALYVGELAIMNNQTLLYSYKEYLETMIDDTIFTIGYIPRYSEYILEYNLESILEQNICEGILKDSDDSDEKYHCSLIGVVNKHHNLKLSLVHPINTSLPCKNMLRGCSAIIKGKVGEIYATCDCKEVVVYLVEYPWNLREFNLDSTMPYYSHKGVSQILS